MKEKEKIQILIDGLKKIIEPKEKKYDLNTPNYLKDIAQKTLNKVEEIDIKNREQKLIDICFELVCVSTGNKILYKKSIPEKMKWVAQNLRSCGYDTHPVGSSWGKLKQ